jgi:hypothetical protein
MAEQDREGESHPGELSSQNQNLIEQGVPHEQLVATFRSLIKEQQTTYAQLHAISENPHEPDVLSPETAVRGVLDWYSGSANQELGEHLFTVRTAWDALAYDRYEPGSREEGLAGSVLQAYSGATGESNIKLTHPMEVRVLDAFTEAAGVPHQRGQTEIDIPEKLRNYNRYLMSREYEAKLAEAQAKRRK